MIQWMRRHNEAGGSVGFYGFDMQYPGMAIDNVARFVAAVDQTVSAEFAQHYECLARYANDASGRSPSSATLNRRRPTAMPVCRTCVGFKTRSHPGGHPTRRLPRPRNGRARSRARAWLSSTRR